MNPLKPVLIIKTGSTVPNLLSKGEDFETWVRLGMGLDSASIRVVNIAVGELLPSLDEITSLVITGSPAYLTDLAPWNYVAADYIRAAVKVAKPLLGICYGHQLLAWAFGAEVGFHPQGRELGTVPIALNDAARNDSLFCDLPNAFAVHSAHQQSVLSLPADAIPLAFNDFERFQSFRLGECAWGVQFHPEFNASISEHYVRFRWDDMLAEGLQPQEILGQVQETPEAASLLRRFQQIAASFPVT